MSPPRPIVLIVLDGFGLGDGDAGDATALADAPFFERAARIYPRTKIETSGAAVGLPDGQMGNSEVGHMTLGAGRILDQDMTRIQKAIEGGELATNAALGHLLDSVTAAGGRLHLMGLISDGGVHSSLSHLEGLLSLCAQRDVQPVLHAFTDGRDTPPRSAPRWVEPLETRLRAIGGCIATLSGRYFAMDRDQRWDRVARAYRAIVMREGAEASSATEAVARAWAADQGDEFIEPTTISGGPPLGDGDGVLFFNFRADRARELTNAIARLAPDALGAEIAELPEPALSGFATLTEYDENFGLPVLFPPLDVTHSLGELVASSGGRQLRIAETEKYAHVTYFFSGGREEPFEGEDRILIPSPRDVPTYDKKPEMSAVQVTDALIQALDRVDYDFVLVNYANPDMVGHTGEIPASIRAIEVVDACLDRLCTAVLARGGELLITADHGNIEMLIAEDGGPHTAHTTNPVPLYHVGRDVQESSLASGGLADLAPTVCMLLDLEVPQEMTGRCLVSSAPVSSSS